MEYAIFSLESGNVLRWFDSHEVAIDVLKRILETEPDAISSTGLMHFDRAGRPQWSLHGQELIDALNVVAA
jgi:hypothetical protein